MHFISRSESSTTLLFHDNSYTSSRCRKGMDHFSQSSVPREWVLISLAPVALHFPVVHFRWHHSPALSFLLPGLRACESNLFAAVLAPDSIADWVASL